ncbi:secreted/surface protein with fasciclin-like repeats [Nostoc sp. PCC 7524]|uniref:fasciclin domain-containing protein n=1 Tax=Nostoc sp. (strain ATCC 29411 / PCC 7524) TaxID=28072 RepID=UPI00029F2A78|nr:fasciclin domain-containing protein [Nostoc sp. PCC 7524]AFY49277.1 secreted/surface protein with fasciclin-like repeats [Nostoc sp. PCC 7524]
MKVNYSKLLTSLTGVVSIAGVSLLTILPSGAKEALNPNPSVFQETSYNRSQRVQVNAQYTPVEAVTAITKGNNSNKKQIAQNSGSGTTNPRPSIFNEAPYNRSRRTTPTTTTPQTKPTTPTTDTEVPTTQTPEAGTTDTQGKTLLEVASSSDSFTVLTKAIEAAGLSEVLQGKDNLTIFAPTDDAFAKLPKDAVRDLLKPENKEVLVKVLTYHVVPGAVLSTDLKSGEVKSVEGGAINVKVDPKTGVTVNDAKVIKADIKASNGVIHAIDQVILPPDL